MNESPNRANVKRKMPEPFYQSPVSKPGLQYQTGSTPSVINESGNSTTATATTAPPLPHPNPAAARIIHHSHTNSLPMMMMQPPAVSVHHHPHPHPHSHTQNQAMPMSTSAVHPSGYVNNNTSSNGYQQPYLQPQGAYYQYGAPTAPMNISHVTQQQQPQPMYVNGVPVIKSGSQTVEASFQSSIQPQHVKTFSLPVSFENGVGGAVPPGTMSNASSSGMLPPPIRPFNSQGDIPLPPGWDFQQAPNGQIYFIK